MQISLSRVKIPQRQGRKIGEFIVRQNLVLPKDFPQQEPKAALKFVPIPPAGDIKQPFSPSSSVLPQPLPSREGKGEEQREERKIEKGVMGEKGMIGGMGKEREEWEEGKGLKFGRTDMVKSFVKPTPSSPKASLDKSVSGSPSPLSSPLRERKNVDIDQKLEELKRKAEKENKDII